MYQKTEKYHTIVIAVLIIVSIILILTSLAIIFPIFLRYQARQQALNEVQINEITIKSQEQLIQVEKQKAQIRVEEAKGISQSQAIINSSLTANYLQYMAIKAQEKMSNSPNHTQIYIPVGTNGIPLVKNID